MKSSEQTAPPDLDLESGLRTTAADSAAQRHRPEPFPTSFQPYFEFLAQFKTDPATLRAKKGPRGEPFKL
jgi:hypothetical protein